ncbi:ParA family protein [Pantoea sp. GM01]|uniref:ParA family protein n=1 Tax=Pantoea sp. GM01 TaxID=1144320 RepID=UPI00056C8929|nr:ParA family protein [Pantoea sp. GM01]
MKILPVISTKGGAGKSTQAANLCGFLADTGLKTLLIDGDFGQPTASSIYQLTYQAPSGIYELLMQSVDLGDATNIISNSFIPHLDVIIIDSQGARSVMLELIALAATDTTIGIVKPVQPDIREFLRGAIAMFEQLRSLSPYGIALPAIRILVNCMDYTSLAKTTLGQLETIVSEGKYSPYADEILVSLLNTQIYDLDIYKAGHFAGEPAHRLETQIRRKSDSALQTMHNLACELFPEWRGQFDALLSRSVKELNNV